RPGPPGRKERDPYARGRPGGRDRGHPDLVRCRADEDAGYRPSNLSGSGPVRSFLFSTVMSSTSVADSSKRPVDQKQVHVVEAERLERPFESLAGVVGLVCIVAQLAGDEDLAAVQ